MADASRRSAVLPDPSTADSTPTIDSPTISDDEGCDDDAHDWGEDLAPGTNVAGYVIDRKIGAGGCGIVYLARHPLIGKRVAVKVLAPARARDPVQVRRFLLEAQSVNAIGHRNIVDVFAFGLLPDGRTYMVMEFLEGEDLGKMLGRAGRLDPAELAPIVAQLARGLSAAHAKGFVHRDLKPENVFVTTEDGQLQVKLLDFGLTKLAESAEPTRKTRKGTVMGTPQYMSPEQARGREVDPTADIYSLGVVLYECLTGRLPFDSNSDIDILIRHASEEPAPPSQIAPLPAGVDRVVLRCLEKDPTRRYASATEVALDLERALAEEVPAPPSRDPVTTTHSEPAGPQRADSDVVGRSVAPMLTVEPTRASIASEAPKAPRRRGPPVLLVVVAAGVLLTGGLLVAVLSRDAGDSAARPRTPVPAISPEPVSAPTARTAPIRTELPAPPLLGELSIVVRARGAKVALDGVDVPVRGGVALASGLTAGPEHRVQIEAPGFGPYETAVRVEAGTTVRLEPVLVRSARSPGRGNGARSSGGGIVDPWE
jgi:serine/threonine-protein kinase